MPKAASPAKKTAIKTATKTAAKTAAKGAAKVATKTAGKTAGARAPAVKAQNSPAAQEAFLDELIRARTRVSIFLVNGVKLEGEIKSYDRYVILMKNAVSDKVYKHAVSTIMPAAAPVAPTGVVIEKRTSRLAAARRNAVSGSSSD